MKNIVSKKVFAALILILITLFVGCDSVKEDNSKINSSRIFALDTVIELSANGDNAQKAIKAAEAEIYRLEEVFSVTGENSDIYKLNNAQGKETTIESDVYILLDYAKYINTLTEGNFDVTVYPVVKEWGFTSKDYRVPDADEIKKALTYVSSENIVLKENYTVQLLNNAQVDLGGIAKGYIADKAAEAMKAVGIEYGIISLGGNIRTVGKKPSSEDFRIGIKHPDSQDYFAVISTDERSVVTSGAYQRNFTIDGKTYHHIIDPKTGYPAQSDIASVTIIGNDGALCDALSTAVFVGGSEYAEKLYSKTPDFDYVILTNDNKVIASPLLKDKLTLSEGFENLEIIYK